MFGKKFRIIMIVMEMGDIEIRWVGNSLRRNALVTGKREPGSKVGRIKPGVTEDTFPLGLYKQASLAQKCDLHPSVLLHTKLTGQGNEARPFFACSVSSPGSRFKTDGLEERGCQQKNLAWRSPAPVHKTCNDTSLFGSLAAPARTQTPFPPL